VPSLSISESKSRWHIGTWVRRIEQFLKGIYLLDPDHQVHIFVASFPCSNTFTAEQPDDSSFWIRVLD
jgi:hypothetical protein